jgi:hypothetical protein
MWCVFIGVLTFLSLTAIVQPSDMFSYECSAGNPLLSSFGDINQREDRFAAFDANQFTESQNGEPNALIPASRNVDFCTASATLATLFAGQNCFNQATTSCSSDFLSQQPPIFTSNSPDTPNYATPPAVSIFALQIARRSH